MNRRMRVYLAIVFGLMAVVTVWSLGQMLNARSAAQGAARDLEDCLKYEDQIARLRARPTLAADRERLAAEIVGPIERAAKAAGVSADRLIRISPEAAQRVCETAYKEKPTRVYLKNVTLQQVVQTVHGLVTAEEGLTLKSVRLTALSRETTTNLWSAELVLAYLIYEPQRTGL